MKKLLAMLILFVPLIGIGQFISVVADPSSSPTFNSQMSLYTSASTDLYVSHTGTGYDSFVFTTDGVTSQFVTDTDSVFNESYSSLGSDSYFKRIDNPEAFNLIGDLNIGFFGFEAADDNILGISELDTNGNVIQDIQLFQNSADTPPDSVTVNASDTAIFTFSHNNPLKGVNYASDDNRFKVFQSYNPNTQDMGFSFIFAVDDRETSLIDFDDGFYYMEGLVAPVPEPSTIAFIGMAGLVGLLYVRRRITKRK